MADLKLVGAVAIKVRPNAKGFRKETQDQLNTELKDVKAEVKVKVKVDADTKLAEQQVEDAADAIEKKSVSLKVGLDHDSILAAQKKFEAIFKPTETIKFNLDDQGSIDQARQDLAELAEMADVEMQFTPDEKGFQAVLDKIAQVRRQKMEIPLEFGTSDEELDALEESMRAALFEASKIDLTYTSDRASIQKAISQIEAELDKIEAYDLPVLLDPESLETAREQLVAELAGVPVELKVNYNDQGSLKAVRDRLMAMMRELGEEKLEVKLNEKAIQEQLDRINAMIVEEIQDAVADPTTLKLNYNINRSSLTRAIGLIDAELDKLRQLTIEPGLNEAELEAAKKKLQDELKAQPVELTINYDDQDSLKAARSRLQSMLQETIGQKVDIIMDEEAIRAELDKVNALIQEEIPKEKKVEIPVQPTGLEIVARQLQFASRARRVPFYVVVDQKSVAVAEGILRSLAGVNTLQSLGRGLESIITKFDTFSLKAGAWSTAIGGLVNSLVYMTSSVFTVGAGIAQIAGLAALAPAAFGAMATSMIIFQGVFKDFGAAVNGDDKAIEKLTESGKKAAAQIRVTFQEIRETISKNFWTAAGDAMLRFTETALPAFSRGLAATSTSLGKVFSGILDSFTNLAAAGQLDTMFNNLVAMFENASGGATKFWDALNIVGLRGSEFLPKFGTWLTEIATQFHDWIVEADKLGNITTWINQGVTALQDMWYATGAIIDQFAAVAKAADLVGENGLDDFRRNMEHIARIMEGEPWQSQMATIFDGARNGARLLNVGLKDLGGTALDSSSYVSGLLILLGQLGGNFLSGISTTFGNFKFQQGTLDSVRGMSELVRELSPSFERAGELLGVLGSISAEVFRNLAPVINTVMRILDDVAVKLEANLAAVAPDLLELSNNILNFASGPIMLLVDGFNNLLTTLNSLPGPLKDAAIAFGTFLLLRNQFGAFASAVSGLWTNMTTSVVKGTKNIEVATASLNSNVLNGVPTNFRKMADGSIREVNRFGTIVGAGVAVADRHVTSFSPAAKVTPKLETLNTSTSRNMTRFQDSFANAVTTATAKLGVFAPDTVINPRLQGMVTQTGAQMAAVVGHVGKGVDTMAGHIARFTPNSISDRLGNVAASIPGIVGRINGALALIGGLPGLALGLLGVAISMIGANAAESARQVDELKTSLDKTTGDATVKTLETIATRMSDVSEAGDGWANFWRGVVQGSKAGNETLDTLGTNVQDVAKIITGSRGEYDKFIGSLKSLGNVDDLKAVGQIMQGLAPRQKATAESLTPGAEAPGGQQDQALERLKKAAEAAKALKLDPKIFDDPAMIGSINKLTGDIEEQRRQFELSQLAAKMYGDQLGLSSVKGQQMSAAMAVIRDTSLDATSKIDAMNRAMQLLNDGGLSEQEAAFQRADGLTRLAENATRLAESIAGSRATLFKEGTGLLNDQNAAASALFKVMDEGADNVKIAAKAAYDAAVNNGDTAAVALAKAREVIKGGEKDLQTIADNAKVPVDELRAQWGKFFNEEWVLNASITGTSEQYKLAIAEAERIGVEFNEKEFTAWLMANPDPAKTTTEEVKAYMQAEATKKYDATLGALPEEAQYVLAGLLGQLTAFETDDYSAILKALNNAGPGVQQAINTLANMPATKVAVLQAMVDEGMFASVNARLNLLANPRLVSFGVTYSDEMRDAAAASRQRFGAILNASGRGMHGFAGEQIKYYANGGIERHVAQIASGRGPIRVWGEKETHGEAYIPYAQSKRPRSLAILSQVAKDFGYSLSKATESYANGGFAGHAGPSTTNSANVNIGNLYTVDADEAVRKIRNSQADALAVAGITLTGA